LACSAARIIIHRNRLVAELTHPWSRAVSQTWTVKDSDGHVLPHFAGASRLEVERKVVPTHYDAFRLHVSSSYREIFARDLAKVLALKDWRVIRIHTKASRRAAIATNPQLDLKLN
jgi:hypothetical protein